MGRGTTFRIDLPLAHTLEPAFARPRSAAGAMNEKLLMNYSATDSLFAFVLGLAVVAGSGCRRNIVRAEPPSVASPPAVEPLPAPEPPRNRGRSRPARAGPGARSYAAAAGGPVARAASAAAAPCACRAEAPKPKADAPAPEIAPQLSPQQQADGHAQHHGRHPRRGKKFAGGLRANRSTPRRKTSSKNSGIPLASA